MRSPRLTPQAVRTLKRFLLVGLIVGGVLVLWSSSAVAVPTNDDFPNAVSITSLPFSNSNSTVGATAEAGEPSPCGGIAATAWYEYTPTTDQIVGVATAGSDFDTVLAAYSGTALNSLSFISCNDDFAGLQSQLILGLTGGTTYYFQAGGFFGATGGLSFGADVASLPTTEPAVVTIDIKPCGTPNSIELESNGVIPVAIIAVDGFDPSTVDVNSVLFAGAGLATPDAFHLEDIDDDDDYDADGDGDNNDGDDGDDDDECDDDGDGVSGDLDLLMHFRTQETNIQPGDVEACLTGVSTQIGAFQGCDSVRIVPPGADGDLDDDDFDDEEEASLGTDQFFYCTKAGLWVAWPPDLNGDGKVSGSDIVMIFPAWLQTLGDPDFSGRFDFNIDGWITGGDVSKLFPLWLQTCQ